MKAYLFSLTLMIHCVLSFASTHIEQTDALSQRNDTKWDIIEIAHVTKDDLPALMSGDLVLKFPAESRVPIALYLFGDFFQLVNQEEVQSTIEIKKTLYVKWIENNDLAFSDDLINWKSFFEFFTGNASIGTSETTLPLIIGAQLNHRP